MLPLHISHFIFHYNAARLMYPHIWIQRRLEGRSLDVVGTKLARFSTTRRFQHTLYDHHFIYYDICENTLVRDWYRQWNLISLPTNSTTTKSYVVSMSLTTYNRCLYYTYLE